MSLTLYVGGLPEHTGANDLRAVFVRFGTVVNVQLERRDAEGKPSAFALVTMASEQEAQVAFRAVNGSVLDGRPLTLVLLKDDALGAVGAEPKP